MMRNRSFGIQGGLRSGVFAAAILVAGGVSPVRAQSGDPIAPPVTTAAPADSTPSSDHVRKPTEPPPFDSSKPAARAARVKPAAPTVAPVSDAAELEAPTRSVPSAAPRTAESPSHATVSGPAAPNPPAPRTPQPRRAAAAVDPWAEPSATPAPAPAPAPASRPTTRERAQTIDPWAEPATTPAPASESRATTRRRAEPPKVIGIDSFGRSSEDPSLEPSAAPRRPRAAGSGAQPAPAREHE
jgi:hypothetical protein